MRAAARAGREAPTGYRWANSGGHELGDARGWHLSRVGVTAWGETATVWGTICGLVGPNTPPVGPPHGEPICGNCARIAGIPRTEEHEHDWTGWGTSPPYDGYERRYCRCGSMQARPRETA